jgi:hypothetical protein
MKKSLLLLLFVIVTNVISSQIITVALDTTQFFEHSALISTPQAIRTGKLIYKDLYEHKPNLSLTFDLDGMVESFSNYTFNIVKINDSNNIIDVVVNENGHDCLVVLGETHEGGNMYIFEYRDGDVIKGFFSKDPVILVQ